MQTKIEYLNNYGLGVATITEESGANKRVFVPYTLEGEVVSIEFGNEKSKFTRAQLKEVIEASPDRIIAPCRYYGFCGGCNLQHIGLNAYKKYKHQLLLNALKQSTISLETISEPILIGNGKRRRAQLKAQLSATDKNTIELGFFESFTNKIVPISECIILVDELNFILADLAKAINEFSNIMIAKEVLEIFLTACTNGVDILFKSKHPCGPKERGSLSKFASKHKINVINWKIDNEYQQIFFAQDSEVSFKDNLVKLPSETFLQVTKESEDIMIDFVLKHTKSAEKVLDLFAGLGTFSIPTANYSRVHAVEGNKEMADNLKHNSKNLSVEIRNLFKNPLKANELERHNVIVINPPRAGAEAQIKSIAKSKASKVILISCDLNSFARDSKVLSEANFHPTEMISVDQFVYTPHLEVLAVFSRR